jgi:hypothetical protein
MVLIKVALPEWASVNHEIPEKESGPFLLALRK